MHPADQFWNNSVEKSFTENWLASSVWRNKNSRRYIALQSFYHRWRTGKIRVCNLPEEFVIFAPSEAVAGFVNLRSLDLKVFMYLGPQLEWDSQQDVNFTVFHELSHIELRHHLLPVDARQGAEDEADAKAQEWGAPKRKRGKRIFERLVKRPLNS